jgi:RNA polymerase sigma-70 factor (ECF subfamily)
VKFGGNSKQKKFEKLYFDHYTSLCRSVFRFVKDKEATKDIVQEVFIKYWKKFDEILISESEIAYLKKACINAALNYQKEKERRDMRESRFATDIGGHQSETPDSIQSLNETSQKINAAIDQLPPKCREVFILSRYEQKSYKEIAQILHISINTVEKHIGKALKLIKTTMMRA